MILLNSHVLAVPDCNVSARFFIEKLGFESQKVVPGWHFVMRDSCRFMLGSCPDAIPPADLGDHSYVAYLNVTDVDALYEEFCANGLDLEPPRDKPWGMRELFVRTPDGHRMTIGQEIHSLGPDSPVPGG